MKFGAINNPLLPIVDEIRRIQRLNFDFIDLTYEPPFHINYDPIEIRDILAENNLFVIGHTNPSFPVIYPSDLIHNACLGEFKNSAVFFKAVGARLMNVHPFVGEGYFSDEQIIHSNIESLRQIQTICEDNNLEMMVENSFHRPFNALDFYTMLTQQMPNVKLHLDIGHANIGNDPSDFTERFFQLAEVKHIHIHDNDGQDDEHLPLGCGTIDWENIYKIICHNKYDKTITLEVFCRDDDYLKLSKQKLEAGLSPALDG